MARWLFNSDGDAVAFVSNRSVYSPAGEFIGCLYPDNTVWNGEYIGEIYADERFFFDDRKLFGQRGLPAMPTLPGFVGDPPYKGPCTAPLGYRDVELR